MVHHGHLDEHTQELFPLVPIQVHVGFRAGREEGVCVGGGGGRGEGGHQ